MHVFYTLFIFSLYFVCSIQSASSHESPILTNGDHQQFVWENRQDGSFTLYFEAGGHKSFSFDQWRGASIRMLSISSISAHMFTSPEQTDVIIIYDSTFQSDTDDIIVLFAYSDLKLYCQRNHGIHSSSSIEVTMRNDRFIPMQHTNCEEASFTPQDDFILQQSRRLGQIERV